MLMTTRPRQHMHEREPTLTVDTVYLTERRIVVRLQNSGEEDQYAVYERQRTLDVWHCRGCGLTETALLGVASGQLVDQHPGHAPAAMVGVRTQRWLEQAWRASGGAY